MDRPNRHSVNIRIAKIISERGTCKRLKVGAVITRDNKIISTGYNGPGPLLEHCNDFQCDIEKPCERATHAEMNAILNANLGFLPDGKKDAANLILYVTHQPCIKCANVIAYVGIRKVYFLEPYRDKSGIEYLNQNQIETQRINEEGNPEYI